MECEKCGALLRCAVCGETEMSQYVKDPHEFAPAQCECEAPRGNLINVIGDVTTPQRVEESEVVYLPHVCNDEGGFGAGVAYAIARKWPGAKYLYCSQIAKAGPGSHNLGKTGFWDSNKNNDTGNVVVCHMISQHNYKSDSNPRPLNYGALAKCMNDVVLEIKSDNRDCPKRIHAPKFGSDLAGGDFQIIMEMIEFIWLNAGIDVVVYEYVG